MAIGTYQPSDELEEAIALSGFEVTNLTDADLIDDQPKWDAILVELGTSPARRLRVARDLAARGVSIILAASPSTVSLIETETWASDFVVAPYNPLELRVRLRHAIGTENSDQLFFEDLVLDLGTYEASVAGRILDLTFMEYQLLTFFVERPAKVWSREQLLSQVWGYEYYGGARTVDVHVRRLRAKIGEERASWIKTVRSVGYRFG
jgi:DNA-binding response OmpR family regulator